MPKFFLQSRICGSSSCIPSPIPAAPPSSYLPSSLPIIWSSPLSRSFFPLCRKPSINQPTPRHVSPPCPNCFAAPPPSPRPRPLPTLFYLTRHLPLPLGGWMMAKSGESRSMIAGKKSVVRGSWGGGGSWMDENQWGGGKCRSERMSSLIMLLLYNMPGDWTRIILLMVFWGFF